MNLTKRKSFPILSIENERRRKVDEGSFEESWDLVKLSKEKSFE